MKVLKCAHLKLLGASVDHMVHFVESTVVSASVLHAIGGLVEMVVSVCGMVVSGSVVVVNCVLDGLIFIDGGSVCFCHNLVLRD